MKQIIYLIRHGHTAGTESDLMYGATELPVTDDGLRAVAGFAEEGIYPDPEGAAVYTSGMVRALQTLAVMYGAEPESVSVSLEEIYPPRDGAVESIRERITAFCPDDTGTEPLLREVNVGPYEMMTVSEILEDDYGRDWLEGRIEEPSFYGGDSMSGFRERVLKGVRKIALEAREAGLDRVIAVIHGGVIAYILQEFFPKQHENVWDWTPIPGTGYKIVLEDGKPVSWSPVGDIGFRVVPKGSIPEK